MRSRAEMVIQRAIEADLGSERDLLLLRNVVTVPRTVDDDGNIHRFPVGLGTGSPDLVGILRREVLVTRPPNRFVPIGTWFCLEVKQPGEGPSDVQKKSHAVWRSFGAFIAVVDSVDGARLALERARRGES